MDNRKNPYFLEKSPIMQIYKQSKKRSLSNQCSHFPLKYSYKQFKVKNIINALNNRHIIQKKSNNQQQKTMQRERTLSKLYNNQNLRGQTFSSEMEEDYYCLQKRQEKQNMVDSPTMLDIRQKYNAQLTEKDMAYESSYRLNNQHKSERRNSMNSVRSNGNNQIQRSSKQRSSFFSQVEDEWEKKRAQKQQSAYVQSNFGKSHKKRDEMREQQNHYRDQNYQDYYKLTQQKSKRTSTFL